MSNSTINNNEDLLSKIQTLESKLNYYRRYKKIIDTYNNDTKFNDIINNYINNNDYLDNKSFDIFEDTNKALELVIDSKILQLKNICSSIENKKIELRKII
jgi:hypothetical protein